MFKKKTYRSVVEMARDVGDDPAFANDLGTHLSERRLVKHLFALRCARGLSQSDVAERLGCTQGRVSKLEASRDEDLRLGDISGYAKALGLTTVLGLEGGPSSVARVKFHHARIQKELDALAKLALKDEKIAEGISRFFNEAALNFLVILEEATRKLPAEVQPLEVSVEIVGPDDDECPASAKESKPEPPKTRRKKRPGAACG